MRSIKTVCGMAICLCLLLFVGCTPEAKTISAENIKDNKTKDYYKNLGYVSVEYDDCFTVGGDLIYFDDGSVFAKSKSNISIEFQSDDFVAYNSCFVNFKTSKILTGISVNSIEFSLSELSADGYQVKSETSVKPVYKDFNLFGIAAVIDDPTINDSNALQIHDGSLFRIKNLLFVKATGTNLIQDARENSLDSNVEFKVSAAGTKLDFSLEFNTNKYDYTCYAILKTDDNLYYLIALEMSGDEYSLNENSPVQVNVKIVKSIKEK